MRGGVQRGAAVVARLALPSSRVVIISLLLYSVSLALPLRICGFAVIATSLLQRLLCLRWLASVEVGVRLLACAGRLLAESVHVLLQPFNLLVFLDDALALRFEQRVYLARLSPLVCRRQRGGGGSGRERGGAVRRHGASGRQMCDSQEARPDAQRRHVQSIVVRREGKVEETPGQKGTSLDCRRVGHCTRGHMPSPPLPI